MSNLIWGKNIGCRMCTHLTGKVEGWPVCKAYPKGIPPMIIASDWDHRNPFDGDGGVQFEVITDEGL